MQVFLGSRVYGRIVTTVKDQALRRNLVSGGMIDEEGNNLLFLDPAGLARASVPTRVLPSGTVVYPVPVPSTRLKFVSHLWGHWSDSVEIDANGLAALLWDGGEGIGTKAVGVRGQDRQISRELLREEMAELLHRMKLPIVGYRLASDRKEVDLVLDNLRGRVKKMKEAGKGQVAAHASKAWWSNPSSRSTVAVDGYDQELIEAAVLYLESRTHTARELATRLRQISDRKWTDVSVRQLIHDLRVAGVPIVSNTTKGSHIAADRSELKAFLLRYRERIDAIEERIADLDEAGRIWFPRDGLEADFSRRWCAAPPMVGRSPRRLQRERAKAEAAARRNEPGEDERQIRKESAQARVDRDTADPVFRALLAVDPDSLTDDERRRVESFREDQDLLAGRRRRRRRGSKKRNGSRQIVKTASAASILGPAGGGGVDPVPW
jgi:hypothetical protein